MSWTNQGTYWRRPLDCHDKLFQSISAAGAPLDREHWLMFGWIQLSFPTTWDTVTQEQRLRDAWSALRIEYPDVAVTLHENEKRYVPLSDDAALEEYVSATFHVETEARCVDDLFPRFKLAPLVHAACYWVPASSQVMIVSPHWRWDLRGLLMVLDALVELTAAPLPGPGPGLGSGAEAANLVPTLDSVLGVCPDPTKYAEMWQHKAEEMLAPFTDGSPAIGLPAIAALPGDTARVSIALSKAEMTAVLDSCRARSLRFTAALHASIVQVTYIEQVKLQSRGQREEEAGAAQYKSWAAFDLRKHLPPPADGPTHAPSLRLLAVPIITDATALWDRIASAMQTLYGQPMDPASDTMAARVPYVDKATSFLATAAPTTEPNLSNVGVLEGVLRKRRGDIQVRDVGAAVQMLTPQLYVHSWSWDGETRVSVCYNEAFYTKTFVQGWLNSVRANLLENLGVEMQ